jgi:hypothetical protein
LERGIPTELLLEEGDEGGVALEQKVNRKLTKDMGNVLFRRIVMDQSLHVGSGIRTALYSTYD